MLLSLKSEAELIICVNSENIQNGRIRSDYNTLYTDDCIKLIQIYRNKGFLVTGVALTVYNEQPKAIEFAEKLKEMGENVYLLWKIEEYPNNLDKIYESFEKNDFIETTRPLVIMTSSGSASGKLSACLSQVYNEHKRGRKVGYAKYDIFPIWDLDINHPLNLAFEAATADSNDRILIDNYYYERYHKKVSNYNRDLDVFPAIKEIMDSISGEEVFASPTEMVINTMSQAILDLETVEREGKAEVCRRYFTYYKQYLRGHSNYSPIKRVEEIMKKNHISLEDYEIIPIARDWFKDRRIGVVVELNNSRMFFVEDIEGISITDNMIVSILNTMFGLNIILRQSDVQDIKQYLMIKKKLSESEVLKMLEVFKGSYAHSSWVLSVEEEKKMKKLDIFLTCEPYLEN